MKGNLRYIDCCDSVVKKIIVSLLCLATVVLFSCAKMTLEPEASVAATGILAIVVENFTGETGSLRSIAPTQLTSNDLSTGYTLKLTGSTGRMTLPERTIALTNGRATLGDIPDGTWHLTLQVYKNTAPTVAILRGDTTVTVNNNLGNEARFTLSPVEGGEGTIRLTINWQEADRAFVQTNITRDVYVRILLRDAVTNADIADSVSQMGRGAAANNTVLPVSNIRYTGHPTANTTTARPAGLYKLVFKIEGGNIPVDVGSVEWTDIIYVESGRETTGTITIPRLIQKPNAPANPTHSKGMVSNYGKADVTFNWNGVYNATAYNLEIIEYTSGTHPTTDQTWNSLVAGNKVQQFNAVPSDANNYANGSNHIADAPNMVGGLLPGQGAFALRMGEYGKKYAVRIQAVNNFGTSAWSYFPLLEFAQRVVPTAPTNFTFSTGRYDVFTNRFLAQFKWTDVANNDGYELELLKFTSGVTPRNDTDWTAQGGGNAANITTWKGESILSAAGSPALYRMGGLTNNSGELTLEIERHGGTTYYAVRLRAYNEGGASAWVYPPTGSLLMPVSCFSQHLIENIRRLNGIDVYDVAMTIEDHTNSTCTYQYEFIYLASGDLIGVLTKPTEAEMDTEWNRLFRLPANNTNVGRGWRRECTTTNLNVQQLNKGTKFPFRVRTVTKSGTAVVDATPWSYYYPAVLLP